MTNADKPGNERVEMVGNRSKPKLFATVAWSSGDTIYRASARVLHACGHHHRSRVTASQCLRKMERAAAKGSKR